MAKFKVEKRTSNPSASASATASSSKANGGASSASAFAAANAADDIDMEEASRAMKLSDKGELVPDKEVRKAAKESKFDDAADEEIMKSESACLHHKLLRYTDLGPEGRPHSPLVRQDMRSLPALLRHLLHESL